MMKAGSISNEADGKRKTVPNWELLYQVERKFFKYYFLSTIVQKLFTLYRLMLITSCLK